MEYSNDAVTTSNDVTTKTSDVESATSDTITGNYSKIIDILNRTFPSNETRYTTEQLYTVHDFVTGNYPVQNKTENIILNTTNSSVTTTISDITDAIVLRGQKRYPESLKTYAHVVDPLLIAIVTLAIFGIVSNACVLLISRFASAGRFSTLVYMRSLCCADMMSGFYGVLKYSFLTRQPFWINCFLPDALVVCALVAEMFVLVGLFADCGVHLLSQTGRTCQVDKYSTIFGMVLIWNGAFIFAFLPQMGWNNVSSSCEFFVFHSTEYISSLAFLFFITLLLMLIFTIVALIGISLFRRRTNLSMTREVQIDRVSSTLNTAVMDSVLHVLAFLPFVLYMLLHCPTCMHARADYADAYILVPIVVIQAKPLLSAIMRCIRTTEISRVISSMNITIKTWLQSRSAQSVDLNHASVRTNPPDHVFTVSDQVDSNPQPEVSLGNLRSGLINASSLATAAAAAVKLPEMPTVTCERCGHVNGSGSMRESSRGSAGHVWHPLQLVYGGRQWQNMRLRRSSLWSTYSNQNPTTKQTNRHTQSDRLPMSKLQLPKTAKPRSHSISGESGSLSGQMNKQMAFAVRKRSNSASLISETESNSSHSDALHSGFYGSYSNSNDALKDNDVIKKDNNVTLADVTLYVPDRRHFSESEKTKNGGKVNPAFESDENSDVT